MRHFLWIGLVLAACDDAASGDDPLILPDRAIVDATVDVGELMDAGVMDRGAVDAMPDAAAPRCAPVEITPADGLVQTAEGPVQGHRDGAVWSWKQVPFVAPPIGDLRWRPPQPAECRDAVYVADAFGPACVQKDGLGPNAPVKGSEDCLQLNIWSPAPDGERRPVLFFIHGGANVVGSASETLFNSAVLYSGKHLAERGDVVVVTIQYRLGMLGFLRTPNLVEESGAAGNFALQDQMAALQWVRANVAAFGGDPERVMVFGESAGAFNTCALLTAPDAAGLFHAALMQSGGCPALTVADAEDDAIEAARRLDCTPDDLACLRAMPAETIVARTSDFSGFGGNTAQLRWGPVVGDAVLPRSPFEVFAAGEQHPVPFVVGHNAEEMASRNINPVQVDSEAQYAAIINGLLPAAAAERILEAYPVSDFESPNAAYIQLSTDLIFGRGARALAQYGATSPAPTWRYYFQRRFETRNGRTPAQHGIELFHVFGTYRDIPTFRPTAGDIAVSEQMMDAWIRLARAGDPSGEGDAAWPAYDAEQRTRVFDDPHVELQIAPREAELQLWDDVLGPI